MGQFVRLTPARRVLLALLAISSLAIGALGFAAELDIIRTHRFTPDDVHMAGVELKGKIYYVSKTERDRFRLYHILLFGSWALGILVVGSILLWDWKKKGADRTRNDRPQPR